MPLPPRIPKADLPPVPSRAAHRHSRPGHLSFLRALDCPIYPSRRPIEAHHLLRADKKRGMGRKAADKYAIPLSRQAHRELHANGNEETWLAAHGVDGRALAAALWRLSGDRQGGLRVIWRAQSGAGRHGQKRQRP